MSKTLALILAAGRGRRAGDGVAKTYREIEGEIILKKTIKQFSTHPDIDAIQVVIHADDQALYQNAAMGLSVLPPVFGGETRAQSVSNGLAPHQDFDFVLIHDGARPFVSHALISRVLDGLSIHQGVIPALPVTDALWQEENGQLVKPVSRENLIAAQTPQGFWMDQYKPLARGGGALDDAQAAIEAGLNLAWVEGEKNNQKLTYPEDFHG